MCYSAVINTEFFSTVSQTFGTAVPKCASGENRKAIPHHNLVCIHFLPSFSWCITRFLEKCFHIPILRACYAPPFQIPVNAHIIL